MGKSNGERKQNRTSSRFTNCCDRPHQGSSATSLVYDVTELGSCTISATLLFGDFLAIQLQLDKPRVLLEPLTPTLQTQTIETSHTLTTGKRLHHGRGTLQELRNAATACWLALPPLHDTGPEVDKVLRSHSGFGDQFTRRTHLRDHCMFISRKTTTRREIVTDEPSHMFSMTLPTARGYSASRSLATSTVVL
jgi:hypothetical protein